MSIFLAQDLSSEPECILLYFPPRKQENYTEKNPKVKRSEEIYYNWGYGRIVEYDYCC